MNRCLIKVLLVALGLLLMMVPACGGGDGGGGSSHSLVGSWDLVNFNGKAAPPNTVSLVFRADGTGTESAEGQSINFVWVLEGSTLTMTAGKDTEVTTLTWPSDNQIQIVDQGDVMVFQRL